MSKIDERLWSDLLADPGADRALAAGQPPRTLTPARRTPLAAGGVLLLGALLAAILVLSGSTRTTPAYALTRNRDGSVTLTLNEVLGVTGANEALARLGVRARIARVEAGCRATAQPIHGTSEEPTYEEVRSMVEPQRTRAGAWIIHPRAIPRGDTVLITDELGNHGRPVMFHGKAIVGVGSSIALYRGTPPSCSLPITS